MFHVAADPIGSITPTPTFGRIRYTGVYPGIALEYDGRYGELEFAFMALLARGGAYQINEGGGDFRQFHRHVVIEFPTMEQGIACCESKEYQDAAAFRRAGGAGLSSTSSWTGGTPLNNPIKAQFDMPNAQ